MYSSILVATDGSGPASRAADLAARIAEINNAKLYAISVYQPVDASSPLAGPQSAGIDAAKGLLEDLKSRYADRIDLITEALTGDPADVIIAEAERHGISLIVVGDRGMTGAKHVLGSVPNSISHRAPCDVLLAHTASEKATEVPLTKALLATDGSKTATAAVQAGAAFAESLGMDTVLTTVANKDGDRILAETEQALGKQFDKRVLQGSVSEAIIDAAAKEGCDMIVTGSRGMQGAKRFLGSVPNSVSHHLTCSMLIVKTA